MTLKILIITAMDEELTAARSVLGDNSSIAFCLSGIGKVNAAIATTKAIDTYKPQIIINTGVAGGLSEKVKIGDLVIATSLAYHDVDVKAFGYAHGQIPKEPRFFPTDQGVSQFFAPYAHSGLIVSGDQFVASVRGKEEILQSFPEALAVDMESAAIAHTAYKFGIPFCALRAISDEADGKAPENFSIFLKQSAQRAADLLKSYINFI